MQAAELQPERRGAFLDAQCDGKPACAAVEELLHFDVMRRACRTSCRARPPASGATLPLSTAVPASFGRYRILRICGEGGMGMVYEAEQDNPRRTVALKVIRPGLVSPELAKRFNHEAQILGRLQHPGIAQVYEAGMRRGRTAVLRDGIHPRDAPGRVCPHPDSMRRHASS